MNVERLRAVGELLRDHPEVHDQTVVRCGTTGCAAGWTVALRDGATPGDHLHAVANNVEYGGDVISQAEDLLDLDPDTADALFFGTTESDDENGISRERANRNALELISALLVRETGRGLGGIDLSDDLMTAVLDRFLNLPTDAND